MDKEITIVDEETSITDKEERNAKYWNAYYEKRWNAK